ncbi:MAG: hypothetical protein PHQ81_09200 [Methanofollis sp.]|nr:hypothetical protein [Methanofollis sp.]
MIDENILIFLGLTALIGFLSDVLLTIFVGVAHLEMATIISACAVDGAWGEVQAATVPVLVGLFDFCIGLIGAFGIMEWIMPFTRS